MIKLTLILLLASFAATAFAEQFTDLGVQITSSTLIGTTISNGVVYSVMRGHPAKLLAIDLKTAQVIQSLPLPGADGAWNACTASDGSIYVGTDANGHLYRYVAGEKQVKDLGNPPQGQTWIWDVTAGKDGEVFGGTYPGGCVFRYSPKDGFSDVSHGSVVPGESYARCVAADSQRGMVYAGIGSHAHLVAINVKTGEKREMLPKEYADQEFVYGLDRFGKFLVALLTRANKSLVFDLDQDKLIGVIPGMGGQQISIASPEDPATIYYVFDGKLMRVKLDHPEKPEKLCPCPNAIGFTWSEGKLVGWAGNSGLFRFDPKTGELTKTAVNVPAEPTDIQSIALGPDGRIWTGGYLSGGNAAFDPATGKSEQYKGLSQAEDMTVLGKTIYFGLYPGAKLSCYDTTKPWDGKTNPRRFGDLGPENQSRPMAMLGVEKLNKVFIGTIPEYGQLGGVLAVYDPTTDKLAVHHDVVPKQSITSLVFANDLIVGGSSIWGGLGQKPEATEAKLFIWDPATDKKLLETVPVPGAKAITGLFVGPDKNVWGMAEGTLFVFNPIERKIVSSQEILPIHYGEKNIWRDAFFETHPSGAIYGTMGDRLFKLDPATQRVTILREHGANMLAMDRAGKLYFRDGTHLWCYAP
jgi:streptogramin lyase